MAQKMADFSILQYINNALLYMLDFYLILTELRIHQKWLDKPIFKK